MRNRIAISEIKISPSLERAVGCISMLIDDVDSRIDTLNSNGLLSREMMQSLSVEKITLSAARICLRLSHIVENPDDIAFFYKRVIVESIDNIEDAMEGDIDAEIDIREIDRANKAYQKSQENKE